MDFLYKHSPSSLDVKIDAVVKKCEETDFQTWLTVPENNTRFIRHWLSEDELNEFAKKKYLLSTKAICLQQEVSTMILTRIVME